MSTRTKSARFAKSSKPGHFTVELLAEDGQWIKLAVKNIRNSTKSATEKKTLGKRKTATDIITDFEEVVAKHGKVFG
jgi:hypothetical protein